MQNYVDFRLFIKESNDFQLINFLIVTFAMYFSSLNI